jgi:TldD protein
MGAPDHHLLDDTTLRGVLAAGLETGGDFAEVYAETRRGRAVRLDDGRVEELSGGRDVGAGVRVLQGGRAGYAYTNLLTRDALVSAARTAAAAVAGSDRVRVADLTTAEPPVRHPMRLDPFAVDGPALVELVRRAEDAARSYDGAIRQVTVRYADTRQGILLANSEGHRHTEERVRTRLVVQVVAARDGELQTAHEAPGAAQGHELFEAHPPEAIARRAAERAVVLLDADPAPAGELPVVLAPGSGGVLFHEACGHGMEADIVAKAASVYRGRQGERIGSPVVSVVDDATLLGHWGSFAFDDEGTPAQRTVLFDAGVCGDYLTDRIRAAELGLPRSGNARRESYAHLPLPRMTNTFIEPGSDDPAAIIAGVDRGLYCDALGGGQVDPASGDFVFGVTLAHLIENGELTRPVRGANLVGDGPTVLARVDAVAGDSDVRQGVCGKDGQGVPAGLGNPTLRIARITVGGTGP